MVGQVNTPAGGVPWEVFTPSQRSHIEFWSNQYNIPVQVMMNMLWQESGTGSIADGTARLNPNATGAPGVLGIAQINMNNTGPGLGVRDPMDEGQAIMGLARGLAVYGTGGRIGDSFGDFRMGTMPFDIDRGVRFYNGGNRWGRAWEAAGRDDAALLAQSPGYQETRNYADSAFRGVTGYNPGQPLPHWGQPLSTEQFWRQNDEALGFVGPRGQVSTAEQWGQNPVGDFWRLQGGPGAAIGEELPWNLPGIIDPEWGHYLQTQGLMPANLQPSGGTDFTNTTWTAVPGAQPGWWGPWGSEAVHNWAQEGVSHGYGDPIMSMLGNLNYNLVDPGLPPGSPPLGGTPSTTIGPTTGLPNVATGGVDLAHWIANQWGSSWGNIGADRSNIYDASNIPQTNPDTFTPGSNVYNAGNMFPADMPLPWDPRSPRAETWAGHEDLRFWTPGQPSGETPGPGPIHVWGGDVTNWVPAPADSTWGTAGVVSPYAGWQQQQQNLWYSPITNAWGMPGGNFGPNTPGVENWSPTTGYSGGVGNPSLPPPGTYSGPGHAAAVTPPPGTFDENTLGSTYPIVDQLMPNQGSAADTISPGPYATVNQQIDYTAAQVAAANAAQVAAANAAQAAHNQNVINQSTQGPWGGGWVPGFGLLY